jgi:hypothetical protein
MRQLILVIAFVLVPVATSHSNPYDDYKALTAAEQRLVLRYFWQVNDVRKAAEYARTQSEGQFPALTGQDDPRDAFRHSLWNASMTRRLASKDAAARWANAHEELPNNPAQRKAMDLFNNERGRELAWAQRTTTGSWIFRRTVLPGDDALKARMLDALRAGELRVIEEVAGQRDPQSGRLVPSYVP